MNWISYISNAMIPLMFFIILAHGLYRKVPLFNSFTDGAEEGLHMAVELLPTFIGLFMAISCMRASGLLDCISGCLAPISRFFHFPSELIPVAITKFVSSSAATSLVLDLFKTKGPDAIESQMAAVMVGATETILYTMSVYYMAVNIRKTRWTLSGAVWSMLIGIAASILIVNAMHS